MGIHGWLVTPCCQKNVVYVFNLIEVCKQKGPRLTMPVLRKNWYNVVDLIRVCENGPRLATAVFRKKSGTVIYLITVLSKFHGYACSQKNSGAILARSKYVKRFTATPVVTKSTFVT